MVPTPRQHVAKKERQVGDTHTLGVLGPVEKLVPRHPVAEDVGVGFPLGEVQAGSNKPGDIGGMREDGGRVAGPGDRRRVVRYVQPEYQGHPGQPRLDHGDAPVVHEVAVVEDGVL